MSHPLDGSEPPLLLSAKLAAELLGVSEMHVKHLVDTGALPGTRIKRRLFIPSASVREFVENVRQSA